MENRQVYENDPIKLVKYVLFRFWILLLCAALGAVGMFIWSSKTGVVTFTASTTVYVVTNNPNLTNYQYTSASDIDNAVRLIDTYTVVMKSNRVLDVVSERMKTPMTNDQIARTLTMSSVSDTGVLRISATTTDPDLSVEVVNSVADVALEEIVRVVGAGDAKVIDYATSAQATGRGRVKKTLIGAAAGFAAACLGLLVAFLLNGKIGEVSDIEGYMDAPLLATVVRMDDTEEDRKKRRNLHSKKKQYLLDEDTPSPILENYKQLRTNLNYTIKGKASHAVVVSSAIPGEGKSTVSANIAIVNAQNNRKTLIIDGDLRKPRQSFLFRLRGGSKAGLTNVLMGEASFEETVRRDVRENLDVLPSGTIPPNPSEMLSLKEMHSLLEKLNDVYDLIVIDTPPINVATDALVLDEAAGMVLIVREKFSNRREFRKALGNIERTGTELLGWIFSAEEISKHRYYYRYYYRRYYGRYYGGYDKKYGYYGRYGCTPDREEKPSPANGGDAEDTGNTEDNEAED